MSRVNLEKYYWKDNIDISLDQIYRQSLGFYFACCWNQIFHLKLTYFKLLIYLILQIESRPSGVWPEYLMRLSFLSRLGIATMLRLTLWTALWTLRTVSEGGAVRNASYRSSRQLTADLSQHKHQCCWLWHQQTTGGVAVWLLLNGLVLLLLSLTLTMIISGPPEVKDECGTPILCMFYGLLFFIICLTIYSTARGTKE